MSALIPTCSETERSNFAPTGTIHFFTIEPSKWPLGVMIGCSVTLRSPLPAGHSTWLACARGFSVPAFARSMLTS